MHEAQCATKGQGSPLKQEIIETYFSEQQQFDAAFVENLFQLADSEPTLDNIIRTESRRLLLSRNPCNAYFFKQLLSHCAHHHLALDLLQDLIARRVVLNNREFELFLIRQLPQFLRGWLPASLKDSIAYLALKIRSFDLEVRLTALSSLKRLVEEPGSKEWEPVLRQQVALMVEKEKLVSEVSYVKGLFLHTLEDEFSEVRQLCIQTIVVLRAYLRPEDLKLILIYMLNDEHEIVREEALLATRCLADQTINREDLDTILMCLREKRTNMRKRVYETLANATLNDSSLLIRIVDTIWPTLQNHRTDKKAIYRMLFALGKRYAGWVEGVLPTLGVLQRTEPNCKSVVYKAKMVLCYSWWRSVADKSGLPLYFSRHMLYVRDVESYLFEAGSCPLRDENQEIRFSSLPIALVPSLLRCEEEMSQEFHRTVLCVLRNTLQGNSPSEKLVDSLRGLTIFYGLSNEQEQMVADCLDLTKMDNSTERVASVLSLVEKCIRDRQILEQTDGTLPVNRCKVSKAESNLVIASPSPAFQERVYLKCLLHPLISREGKMEFKKLSVLPRLRQDNEGSFFSLSLGRYQRVDSLLLLPDQSYHILDSFSPTHLT